MRIGITERGDAALDQSWRHRLNEVDGVILITKAPHRLGDIPDRAIIHCTITGFGGTILEPGVAKPEVTLQAYHQLISKFGGERVILRVDPIIPTEKGMNTAMGILAHAEGRVRISFLDAYQHVRERFANAGLNLPWEGLHAPLSVRKEALKQIREIGIDPEICGEPDLPCTGCVSTRDLGAIGLVCKLSGLCGKQRPACSCAAEKKELLSRKQPCSHGCLYCYWK